MGTAKSTTIYFIYRSLLPFDTSPIPDDAAITSATLRTYVSGRVNYDNDGDDFITLVQSTQVSSTALATTDYARTGATDNPTEGIDATERKDITSVSAAAWLTFNLNTTGLGFVSQTGSTLLALREGRYRLAICFHLDHGSQQSYVTFRTSENTGTTYDPLLTVTYTLTNTVTADVSTTSYAYDGFGARVSKAVLASSTGSTTTTIYPSGGYSVEGGVATVYVGGPGGVSIASMENTSTTSSTLSTIAVDHLGSTAVLTDSAGAMTELLDYHGYGNTRLTSGSATAKKTFIGQYADDETSLSYLNARYYDPARGQFMSQDSVFMGMGTDRNMLLMLLLDPQSQNSYTYARNNPIVLKDASGKCIWDLCIGEGAAFVAVATLTWTAAAAPRFTSKLGWFSR